MLVVPGCARPNPAFGFDDDASGTGEASGAEIGSGDPAGGTADSASASGDASTSNGGFEGTDDPADTDGEPAECGNGVLEGDEDCDDGNLENEDLCLDDCTLLPTLDWEFVPDVEPGIPARFNKVAVRDDVVVAVGRTAESAAADHGMVLVSFDRAEGAAIDQVLIPYGTGQGAEARAVGFLDTTAYYAGRGNDDPPQTSLVGTVEVQGNGVFASPQTLPIAGSRAQGLGFRTDGVVIGSGIFNGGGLGFVSCAYPLAECVPSQLNMGQTQIDDLQVVDDLILGVGFFAGDPFIFSAETPLVSEIVTLWSQPGPGRFQSIAVDDGVIYAAGTRDAAVEGEAAWIIAYSLFEEEVLWSRELDTPNEFDDEFEDIGLTPQGHVVAVGMLEDPPRPVIYEFDRDEGFTRWSTVIDAPGGFESGHGRGVAVEGDEIFVVGEWRVVYDSDDGLDSDSVPFLVRFVR